MGELAPSAQGASRLRAPPFKALCHRIPVIKAAIADVVVRAIYNHIIPNSLYRPYPPPTPAIPITKKLVKVVYLILSNPAKLEDTINRIESVSIPIVVINIKLEAKLFISSF